MKEQTKQNSLKQKGNRAKFLITAYCSKIHFYKTVSDKLYTLREYLQTRATTRHYTTCATQSYRSQH